MHEPPINLPSIRLYNDHRATGTRIDPKSILIAQNTLGEYVPPREYAEKLYYLRWFVVPCERDIHFELSYEYDVDDDDENDDFKTTMTLTEIGLHLLSQIKGKFSISTNGSWCFEDPQDAMIFKMASS